jgi:chromosome segregation ATPase
MPETIRNIDEQLRDLLKKLSDNEVRLGESISALTTAHNALEHRVRILEAKEQSNEVVRAREDERDKVLYSRLDKIERKTDALDGIGTKISTIDIQMSTIRKDVDSIKGGFSKIMYTAGGTLVVAIVGFIIKGGLG